MAVNIIFKHLFHIFLQVRKYYELYSMNSDYFNKINKNGLTQFQTLIAYLGGSAYQTVIDNPITAYRQLVQQYNIQDRII